MQTQQTFSMLYRLSVISQVNLSDAQYLLSKTRNNNMTDDGEAPPEVHHYSSLQEVPWDIQK